MQSNSAEMDIALTHPKLSINKTRLVKSAALSSAANEFVPVSSPNESENKLLATAQEWVQPQKFIHTAFAQKLIHLAYQVEESDSKPYSKVQRQESNRLKENLNLEMAKLDKASYSILRDEIAHIYLGGGFREGAYAPLKWLFPDDFAEYHFCLKFASLRFTSGIKTEDFEEAIRDLKVTVPNCGVTDYDQPMPHEEESHIEITGAANHH